jgi:hypothetical protein
MQLERTKRNAKVQLHSRRQIHQMCVKTHEFKAQIFSERTPRSSKEQWKKLGQ